MLNINLYDVIWKYRQLKMLLNQSYNIMCFYIRY
nr:MAG TPA: hypothetical protein [Caudoviricetes sp.]